MSDAAMLTRFVVVNANGPRPGGASVGSKKALTGVMSRLREVSDTPGFDWLNVTLKKLGFWNGVSPSVSTVTAGASPLILSSWAPFGLTSAALVGVVRTSPAAMRNVG